MKAKPKLIGLLILLAVVAAAGIYLLISNTTKTQTLSGFLGGEKVGLFEDEEVQQLLQKKYRIAFDYAKAGSLEMVTADHAGQDFLFPSSQTAREYYQQQCGSPVKSDIVFNTPLVLYTHAPILEALLENGMVTEMDSCYYMDMESMVFALENKTTWAELGLNQLYGNFCVYTTDPVKSNSGNMFAGLLANVLSGEVADVQTVSQILPRLQSIFKNLGYMDSSSADLFDQFLKTGMGTKPIVAGYESQILEFSVENPNDWAKIKDDIIMIYPSPTVWSAHVYIALDDAGTAGIAALQDNEVQQLAWEKHGFRTGVSGAQAATEQFDVRGLAADVTRVVAMPDYAAMEKIIAGLQ